MNSLQTIKHTIGSNIATQRMRARNCWDVSNNTSDKPSIIIIIKQ